MKNKILIILICVFFILAFVFIFAAFLFGRNSGYDDVDIPYIVSQEPLYDIGTGAYSFSMTQPFTHTRPAEITDDIIVEGDTTLPDIDFVSLYRLIRANLYDLKTSMFLPYNISNDDIMNVMDMLYHKDEEIFWVKPDFSCEYKSDGVYLDFIFADNIKISDVKGMQDELSAKIFEIASAANELIGDYDKIRYVYDYIIDNVSYGQLLNSDDDIISHTAYGCLVDNVAVCDGYAKAFSRIMRAINIESGIVLGTDINNSDDISHAWNYVRLDDRYYWLDITWDDYATERSERGRVYTNFLISDDVLYKTHFIPDTVYNDFIPRCSKSYGQWLW